LPPAGRMSGRIMFNDQDLAAMSTQSLRQVRGAQIGFVAQNPFDALNPVLSIGKQFENVILAHRKGTRRDVREDATELLASVGIPDPDRVLRGYAHELSGGMAQRVVLAIALSLDPQLLIADEPTTALDLTVQRQVLDLMRTIVESTNRSMLLVTHDLTVVATYCERVGVMYQGKILEVGDVESVFTRPQHPYTKALLDAAAGKGRLYGQTQTSMSAHERS
jgi:ABC-type dipeptide/oligopeptide/nickel transport system ATPase component